MVRAMWHCIASSNSALSFYYLGGSKGWIEMEGYITLIMWRRELHGNGLNHCPLGKKTFPFYLSFQDVQKVFYFI